MINKTIIANGVGLMKVYLPNLFLYISEKEFELFLQKAHQHSTKNGGGTPNNNFLATFFMLVDEHYTNNSNDIRNEFGYFNFLLGEFQKFENGKKFKSLILAAIYNFKSSSFKHILGEIAACIDLSIKADFVQYEKVLDNGKSIDFHFKHSQNQDFYIDVVNIDFNIEKYEKENFKKFLDGRLLQKFEDKSANLDNHVKNQIIIYPILYGFTPEIIKDQEDYLKLIHLTRYPTAGFQSFDPKLFGNIQGTFFNLFSIDQIVNSKKYYN